MKLEALLLFAFLISMTIFSFVKGILSTSREFEVKPNALYLNWTNSYQANLTINSTSNISLIFNNSTLVEANYSQGSGIELLVKNQTGDFSNTSTINTSESNFTIFTLIANLEGKMPGRYKGFFSVENSTNSSENASVEIVVDLPIEINSSTGIGNFNGTLPENATEYHSFYFNCSAFPNATSITVNVSFVGEDLDLFLLVDGKLKAKSIEKTENKEKLSLSFIDPNATYEIRVYGNSNSVISYNGTVAVLALSSSQEEIDFESKSVSLNVYTKSLNLTNEGNVSIENVSESLEFYYLKELAGTGARNFTFFLPNSSVFEKIKIRLIWNGTGAYNLSVFNSSELVGNSYGKYLNANMSNVEKEEFVEVNNGEKAGWWRVEVKNTSANYSSYQLVIQAFANASKWIKTNFSDYENKTFDVGSENSTKTIEVNLTTPVDAITGRYEGFLIYSAVNGGQLRIPLHLELTNRLNVTIIELVNETVNVSSQPAYVNVTFNLAYVNGRKISPPDLLDFTKNMTVWLYEPNASYSTGNLNFSNISSATDWKINLTVPKIPGGKYFVHINLTSEAYQGESLDDSINKILTVDDTGLSMSLMSYPSSLEANATSYVNVSIKNFGHQNAINAKIKIFKGNCLSSVSLSSSNCQRSGSGDEIIFNLSAYNYTGCYIVWKIVAGATETSCTSWINGTAGTWFRNESFDTSVSVPTTTTTLPQNYSLPTTTSTTTSTTTTTTVTTTTTMPQQPIVSQRIEIASISANLPATVNIAQAEKLKIQKIIIAVNKNLSNVVLNVKEGSKPEGMPPPLKEEEGLVLKYLEISSNISSTDIANATIEFQVEKSWVETNNIDANTIALYRYSNNTWNKLPTSKINESMNYYYFKSISPGFSLFAIAGLKARGLPNWVFFLGVGIIIAAILAFLFWPVEERKEEETPFQKVERKEEEIRKPWEELKKKWNEFMKREKEKSS
jgi:PGF-pre-PGF domain-containing protein